MLPVAFFLIVNFSISSVKILFLIRITYFLFLISLFILLRKFNLDKILKTIAGGISLIIFSYGIIQKFVLFPIYLKNLQPEDNFYSQAIIKRIESGRIFALFRLPTLYAIICAILILFIFHYLLKSRKNKISWTFLLTLGLVNLILTQSFGGIIYLSVGILTYLFLSGIVKFKYLAPILMIFFLFFSITIAFRYTEAKKMEPLTLRFSNWVQAARAIKSNPFYGVGLGNYESKVSYFTRRYEARSIYAHNFFLQFTAETGIFIPFFLLLILILSRKKLKPDNPRGTDKVLYISVFFTLFSYNLTDIGFYFFSAGLAGVVILSQIYPIKTKRKFKLNLLVLALLSVLMAIEAVSSDYCKEGDFSLNQKKYLKAESSYKKSFGINPFNFKSLGGYAFLKFSMNNYSESEKYLDRVLTIYPDSSFAHYWMSKVELKKGHLFKAFFHASRAYQKNKLDSNFQMWYQGIKNSLENRISQVSQ